jgi:hypothetical protein
MFSEIFNNINSCVWSLEEAGHIQQAMIVHFRKQYYSLLFQVIEFYNENEKCIDTITQLLHLCIDHRDYSHLLEKEILFVKYRIRDFEINNHLFQDALSLFYKYF